MIKLCRILNWKQEKKCSQSEKFYILFHGTSAQSSYTGETSWWIFWALPVTWGLCMWTITCNKLCNVSSVFVLVFLSVEKLLFFCQGIPVAICTPSNWILRHKSCLLWWAYRVCCPLGIWHCDSVAVLASARFFGSFRGEGIESFVCSKM